MAETIVLDPTEVATARTQFDLTPFIDAAGPDWGDAAITQYLAEANRGQIPVDYRVPNRTITIPLNVMARGTVTFDQARSQIQAKAGLMQREGGWLKRVTSGGTAVFADITNATLKYGGGWSQAYKSYDVDASLVLEAIPDFYGAEIDLGDNVENDAARAHLHRHRRPGGLPGQGPDRGRRGRRRHPAWGCCGGSARSTTAPLRRPLWRMRRRRSPLWTRRRSRRCRARRAARWSGTRGSPRRGRRWWART